MWFFWVIFGIVVVFLIIGVYSLVNRKRFAKLFDKGNVIVSGLRGAGKDLAFCVVVNTRKLDYISNVEYSDPKKRYKCFPLSLKVWELSGNTYTDLITGEVKQYVYPYPDGIDYYISDAGIYFPAQYQSELCKKYKSAPMFQALSRHLGDCNVHCNVQNVNRLWDKIREQSDTYVLMDGVKFIGRRLCHVRSFVYSMEDSCVKRVKPPRFGLGKSGKQAKIQFETNFGTVQRINFWCRLPYAYDSRRFKKILENGCIDYE